MKYLQEYRNSQLMQGLQRELERCAQKPLTIMEICGGQTHSIIKYGIDRMLPDTITLVHGPGCPVCVTPEEKIDTALRIARRDNVIFCSYGDMLRVPGRSGSLLQARAEGADVRILLSPQELLSLAERNPSREVVFFAIGFETTVPAHALVLLAARRRGLTNLSFLTAHVLVPPAIRYILSAAGCGIQGFLAAGHVCTITGYEAYHELARQYAVPIVVTGFEPVDILQGVLSCVKLFHQGVPSVDNQYSRSVREAGNSHARAVIKDVFEIYDARWRGIGFIPGSGLRLASAWQSFDAETRFGIEATPDPRANPCRAGAVLLGHIKPMECPYFGERCTPEHPLGSPMVSSEGACAAYYLLRHREEVPHAERTRAVPVLSTRGHNG